MLDTLRALPVFQPQDLRKSVILALLEGLCAGMPYGIFIAIVTELMAVTPDWNTIIMAVGGIGYLMAIRAWLARETMKHAGVSTFRVCATLRSQLAEHFFRVPMGFFQTHDSGELSQGMNKDVEITEGIFSHLFPAFVATISLFFVVTLSLLIWNWQLACALLAGLPLAVVTQFLLRRKASAMSATLMKSMSDTNTAVMDWVLGIRERKLSGNGDVQMTNLEEKIRHTQHTSLKHEVFSAIAPISFIVLSETGFALFLLVGLQQYFAGTLELPVLLVFLIASVRLYRALGQLAMFMAESRFTEQAAQRLRKLLHSPEMEIGDADPDLTGRICVNNLSFRYPDDNGQPGTIGLSNISFEAKPGTLTAVVGSSGAGKSTLLHMLARFWHTDEGEICLDEHSLHSLSDASLYRQVALVSQQVQLFDDSILNNLKMAKEGLTDAQVFDACRKACCHDFICQLPHGYKSQVGEAGNMLSGGEKQRLALARALLTDARIILLDEISSALDVQNEQAIIATLNHLKKDRTLIMIAHRESMVRDADQVLLLHNGALTASGTHSNLLAANPGYQALWHQD